MQNEDDPLRRLTIITACLGEPIPARTTFMKDGGRDDRRSVVIGE